MAISSDLKSRGGSEGKDKKKRNSVFSNIIDKVKASKAEII